MGPSHLSLQQPAPTGSPVTIAAATTANPPPHPPPRDRLLTNPERCRHQRETRHQAPTPPPQRAPNPGEQETNSTRQRMEPLSRHVPVVSSEPPPFLRKKGRPTYPKMGPSPPNV